MGAEGTSRRTSGGGGVVACPVNGKPRNNSRCSNRAKEAGDIDGPAAGQRQRQATPGVLQRMGARQRHCHTGWEPSKAHSLGHGGVVCQTKESCLEAVVVSALSKMARRQG